jgi:hypothetical protein
VIDPAPAKARSARDLLLETGLKLLARLCAQQAIRRVRWCPHHFLREPPLRRRGLLLPGADVFETSYLGHRTLFRMIIWR